MRYKHEIAAIIAVFIWSFVTPALARISALPASVAASGILIAAWGFFFVKIVFSLKWSSVSEAFYQNIDAKSLGILVVAGGCLSYYFSSLIWSLRELDAAKTEFMRALWPTFLLFVLPLLSQRRKRVTFTVSDFALLAVVLSGAGLLSADGNFDYYYDWRLLIPLSGGFAFAVHSAMIRGIQDDLELQGELLKANPQDLTLFAATGFATAICAIRAGTADINQTMTQDAMLTIAAIGALGVGLASALYTYALGRRSSPFVILSMPYAIPGLTLIWLFFLSGQLITWRTILGAILFVGGNVGLLLGHRRRNIDPEMVVVE